MYFLKLASVFPLLTGFVTAESSVLLSCDAGGNYIVTGEGQLQKTGDCSTETELNFSSPLIKTVEPGAFGSLTNLKTLSIVNTMITDLTLDDLEANSLILKNNQLTNLKLENMHLLESMIVNNNQNLALENISGVPSLRNLEAHNNKDVNLKNIGEYPLITNISLRGIVSVDLSAFHDEDGKMLYPLLKNLDFGKASTQDETLDCCQVDGIHEALSKQSVNISGSCKNTEKNVLVDFKDVISSTLNVAAECEPAPTTTSTKPQSPSQTTILTCEAGGTYVVTEEGELQKTGDCSTETDLKFSSPLIKSVEAGAFGSLTELETLTITGTMITHLTLDDLEAHSVILNNNQLASLKLENMHLLEYLVVNDNANLALENISGVPSLHSFEAHNIEEVNLKKIGAYPLITKFSFRGLNDVSYSAFHDSNGVPLYPHLKEVDFGTASDLDCCQIHEAIAKYSLTVAGSCVNSQNNVVDFEAANCETDSKPASTSSDKSNRLIALIVGVITVCLIGALTYFVIVIVKKRQITKRKEQLTTGIGSRDALTLDDDDDQKMETDQAASYAMSPYPQSNQKDVNTHENMLVRDNPYFVEEGLANSPDVVPNNNLLSYDGTNDNECINAEELDDDQYIDMVKNSNSDFRETPELRDVNLGHGIEYNL
eukprot:Awhi_evm1s11650